MVFFIGRTPESQVSGYARFVAGAVVMCIQSELTSIQTFKPDNLISVFASTSILQYLRGFERDRLLNRLIPENENRLSGLDV